MDPREIISNMDPRYALFGFLFALNNRLQAVGDRFYEEITCKQFFLMACMSLFPPEGPSLQALAQVMGCSHQNAKTIALKLAEKGLLTFSADPNDKRKQRLAFTEQALQMAERHHTKETDFMNKLFAGIPPQDLIQAFETLSKMEDNLKKISEG